MAASPTLDEEDSKRPHRERESLVAERTRIINRMKGCLARLGIRGYKPNLQRATKLLPALRTPEGTPLPPNARDGPRPGSATFRRRPDQGDRGGPFGKASPGPDREVAFHGAASDTDHRGRRRDGRYL